MKTFKVETVNRDVDDQFVIDTIFSDYMIVQEGHLFFRNLRKSADEYPELVKVYAPGSWNTVTPETIEDRTDLYLRTEETAAMPDRYSEMKFSIVKNQKDSDSE